MIKDGGLLVFRDGIYSICADIYRALGCIYDIDVNVEGQPQETVMDAIAKFQKV